MASPDPLAQLEAQRAHFASDEHIREEVAMWADTTPNSAARAHAATKRASG